MRAKGRLASSACRKCFVIVVTGLSEAKKRAFILADNRIAASAGWDRERLSVKLKELIEIQQVELLDVSVTGFAPAEIDQLIIDFEEPGVDPADYLDPGWHNTTPVSKAGPCLASRKTQVGVR